jgi:hypothetical protein
MIAATQLVSDFLGIAKKYFDGKVATFPTHSATFGVGDQSCWTTEQTASDVAGEVVRVNELIMGPGKNSSTRELPTSGPARLTIAQATEVFHDEIGRAQAWLEKATETDLERKVDVEGVGTIPALYALEYLVAHSFYHIGQVFRDRQVVDPSCR